MTATLPDKAFPFVDEPEFATIATINPDGQPQLSVVWVERHGNDIVFSTVKGRRKHLNIDRDPRVTILIWPKANPWTYLEVRGTATYTEEGGRELIDRLCRKYTGNDRYTMDDGTDNVRIVVTVTPTKVVFRG